MKRKRSRMARRYRTTLQEHLQRESRASLRSAQLLGGEAASLGLGTADLARIHEQAVRSLDLALLGGRLLQRAEKFFAVVIAPIAEPAQRAHVMRIQVNQLNDTLRRHKVELAASSTCLKRGVIQRRAAEKVLQRLEENYGQLVLVAHQVQKQLQSQAHGILTAQEEERRQLSRELQDEVAQTLLGIHVRLLALKNLPVGVAGLKKEIASTQQLVEQSVQSINRSLGNFTTGRQRKTPRQSTRR